MTEGRQTAGRETDRIEGRQTDRRADRQANRDRIQRQCTTGRRYLGRLLQDDNGTGHSGQHPAVASSPRGGHADHRSLHQDVLVLPQPQLTKLLRVPVVSVSVLLHRLSERILKQGVGIVKIRVCMALFAARASPETRYWCVVVKVRVWLHLLLE